MGLRRERQSHAAGPWTAGVEISAIARTRTREVISAGESYRVFGAAWGSDTVVDKVELSTDNGVTWESGTFLDEARPFVWRRWQFDWRVPAKQGTYILKSRATDRQGNVQPEHHDKEFGAFVVDYTLGIEVFIR